MTHKTNPIDLCSLVLALHVKIWWCCTPRIQHAHAAWRFIDFGQVKNMSVLHWCLVCTMLLHALVNARISPGPRNYFNCSGQPWCDPSAPLDARVESLLSELTFAEKVGHSVLALAKWTVNFNKNLVSEKEICRNLWRMGHLLVLVRPRW